MTRRHRTLLVGSAVAAIVTAANVSEGAYFSRSWGWVALAFLVPTTLLLIFDHVRSPGLLRIVFAGFVCAFAAWIGLSSLWSAGPSAPIREFERMLAYAAVALAVALVLGRGDGPAVLGGSLVGITVVSSYGLATRLVPDRFDTYDDPGLPYRLSEPLGYWNALGLLAGMGVLVVLAVVAHGRTRWSAVAAGALPVLTVTLYFTFSRGAWVAYLAGFTAMVAFDRRRLRLLWTTGFAVVPSIAAVGFASRQYALTTEGAPVPSASAQGHRVAALLVVLSAASVAAVWGARWVAARVPMGRRNRRVLDVALVVLVAVACVAALIRAGGPVNGATQLKARFEAPNYAPADLNSRLFSFSGSGRAEQIDVALDAGRERPLLGYGAGSYEALWYRDRVSAFVIRDAHSLYAETFGELGIVGLVLLCCALVVPLLGVRSRSRFVPGAAAAYLAWVLHAALDWDWEMVGLTIVALLLAGVLLLGVEPPRWQTLSRRARLVLVGVTTILSVAAVVSLVGNQALFAGREALARGDRGSALVHAKRAEAILVWSAEADVLRGDVAAGLGDRKGALRAYREASEAAPNAWVVWARIGQVGRGAESRRAWAEVRRLNPLERNLPGQPAG